MEITSIGVLGSGQVGRVLAAGFRERGHEVAIGTRAPEDNDDLIAWAAGEDGVAVGSFAAVAEGADIVVLATAGVAVEEAISLAGPHNFTGKVVIDVTNPLDFSSGGPELAVGHTDSGGESVQRTIPGASVVKAFNTVGNGLFVEPDLPGEPPTMFIAGDDAAAKSAATGLLAELGWDVADMGSSVAARAIEPLCILWCIPGFRENSWTHAFKLLR